MIKKYKKYKMLLIIGLAVFLLSIVDRYVKPYYEYTINDNEPAIKNSIREMAGAPIQIKKIQEVANKKVVLFSIGSEVGDSELTIGPNHKLKIDSAGHGSNNIRYRVMNTDEGQYVRFLGKNENKLKKLLVFVDDERYHLTVPEGEYFITWVALKKPTESSFPSGSVWYDDDGDEIARIGISNDYNL